jgi:hypothetical protein
MTAKHTPGPWRRENGELVGSNGALVRVAGTGLCLAMRDNPEALANGRLFLAAPELLAAVLELREWINNWEPDFASDDEWPDTEQRVRAAIAKAIGDEA